MRCPRRERARELVLARLYLAMFCERAAFVVARSQARLRAQLPRFLPGDCRFRRRRSRPLPFVGAAAVSGRRGVSGLREIRRCSWLDFRTSRVRRRRCCPRRRAFGPRSMTSRGFVTSRLCSDEDGVALSTSSWSTSSASCVFEVRPVGDRRDVERAAGGALRSSSTAYRCARRPKASWLGPYGRSQTDAL